MNPEQTRVDAFVPTLLGLIVSDSISRTVYANSTPLSTMESQDLAPKNQPIPDDTNGYVMRVVVDRYGYGFALRGVPSKFAIATLLSYVVIVLGHMAYVLVICCTQSSKTHLSSDIWGSVGEMLALGIGSTPQETLHTDEDGARNKIDWRSMVTVRKNKDQHLELQFS